MRKEDVERIVLLDNAISDGKEGMKNAVFG
jgi:hypothetical protein